MAASAGGQALPRPRTSGSAIAALVLGIAGLVVVPIIPSIVAIVLGRGAQSDIARNPALGGEGLAKAGVILGWVGLAVSVLGFLMLLALV
ncbi:MAG: DUF4190 domain-containing protein [Actinomycetota bacterium]|nr:DUF4190 domain-containing protein [Actinomycetota bacterium]